MKVFLKNTIIKKILIVFITIIMTSNFIMPNYVCATEFTEGGEKLVSGFFQLLAYAGDAGIAAMQWAMKGTWNIKEYGEYAIKYSPGLIFANEVMVLDIDFINSDKTTKETITRDIVDVDSNADMKKLLEAMSKANKFGEHMGDIKTIPVQGTAEYTSQNGRNIRR